MTTLAFWRIIGSGDRVTLAHTSSRYTVSLRGPCMTLIGPRRTFDSLQKAEAFADRLARDMTRASHG